MTNTYLVLGPFFNKNNHCKYKAGQRIELPVDQGERFIDQGLVQLLTEGDSVGAWPWGVFKGRELSTTIGAGEPFKRIVVCLNVWQDLEELEANYMTWYPYVDHVIAVDGAYKGMGAKYPYSTDGTVEFLKGLDKVELIETEEFWVEQCTKRSMYFAAARPGDLLWKIDADEYYENAERIRDYTNFDVGWVRYTAPIYQRPQDIPVMFAYQEGLHYKERHHYVFNRDGELVKTNQLGGKNQIHRLMDIRFHNSRGKHRSRIRVDVAKQHRQEQWNDERRNDPSRGAFGHDPLRILQLGMLDPGAVMFRLHTAINTTTPCESIMATTKREWIEEPRQYSFGDDKDLIRQAAASADIVHCHLSYHEMMSLGIVSDAKIVIHHHGTMFRKDPLRHRELDGRTAGLRLASNYELLEYGDTDLNWLPNPVPVAEYRRLAEAKRVRWKYGTLRIAHSPTKKENKNTEALVKAVDLLKEWGLDVELVLIHKVPLVECLDMKASCHVTFDSFWLGLQCSGLEAAAMGQPVIAGDEKVAAAYRKHHGEVPYTYANTLDGLTAALEKLATDETFYNQERERVSRYCVEVHDYPVVAQRYLNLLDMKFDWKRRFRVGQDELKL